MLFAICPVVRSHILMTPSKPLDAATVEGSEPIDSFEEIFCVYMYVLVPCASVATETIPN